MFRSLAYGVDVAGSNRDMSHPRREIFGTAIAIVVNVTKEVSMAAEKQTVREFVVLN